MVVAFPTKLVFVLLPCQIQTMFINEHVPKKITSLIMSNKVSSPLGTGLTVCVKYLMLYLTNTDAVRTLHQLETTSKRENFVFITVVRSNTYSGSSRIPLELKFRHVFQITTLQTMLFVLLLSQV